MTIANDASTSVHVTGSSRLPMVAGWDRLLPSWFSRLHPRYKTPINSIIFVGAITLLSPSRARSAPEFRKRFNSSITPRMFSTALFTSRCSQYPFLARARFVRAPRFGCALRRSAVLPSRCPLFFSPSTRLSTCRARLSFGVKIIAVTGIANAHRRRHLFRWQETSARLTAVFGNPAQIFGQPARNWNEDDFRNFVGMQRAQFFLEC